MRYNDSCSAGVAHLAERHLAKVEVASSNLVARSKATHLLLQVGHSFRYTPPCPGHTIPIYQKGGGTVD